MADIVESMILNWEYRVSRTIEGLWIEVLDYHAGPLLLDEVTLHRLGVRLAPGSSRASLPTTRPPQPRRCS